MRTIWMSMFVAALLCPVVKGEDNGRQTPAWYSRMQRLSLNGLRRIHVTATPGVTVHGLTGDRLRTIVELELRRAGIPVVDDNALSDKPSGSLVIDIRLSPPIKGVHLTALPNHEVRLYSAQLTFWQGVILPLNQKRLTAAITWRSAATPGIDIDHPVFRSSLSQPFQEGIRRAAQSFANDFLAANPDINKKP